MEILGHVVYRINNTPQCDKHLIQFIQIQPESCGPLGEMVLLSMHHKSVRKVSFCLFCRSDLIQYEKLQKSNAIHNLNNAFTVAEEKLGLTRLLDAEGNKWGKFFHISKKYFLNLRV